MKENKPFITWIQEKQWHEREVPVSHVAQLVPLQRPPLDRKALTWILNIIMEMKCEKKTDTAEIQVNVRSCIDK